MSGGTPCYKMLDVLCPMHVVLDQSGKIGFAGPTAKKLLPGRSLVGLGFLDIFEIKRPHAIETFEALRQKTGMKLHLRFRDPPHRELKGVLMEGPETGQVIVNLSFGISVADAVRDYKLTSADFAATDLTIEMLYLVEAKSAAMEASRQLNVRLQGARVEAEAQALTDTLTGLKNRRAMDQALEGLVASGESFAAMLIDLDYFKAVNDTLGHAAGDFVLGQVASIMLRETRTRDTVARVGGDEFVLLLREIDDASQAERIARRIINLLSEPMIFEGARCKISASAGTAMSRDYKIVSADQMLVDADLALYQSKKNGRGRHTFYAADLLQPPAEEPAPEIGAPASKQA
ncbi:diguanylate cyclase [Roseobacter sp. YSTF-M11]|uniref:Diguanylate cyclase n=1 Tax=Roseobacter insulae TaxID=2859783 RepID=A0A9X1FV10_9RHOB|nr:diguanylate cyclase [Roseobacter insulae]MBW4708470.1 diguanylate cyclase [Roseobacter insulae]